MDFHRGQLIKYMPLDFVRLCENLTNT